MVDQVLERTCAKWVARYRSAGPVGLLDRSSAPRRVHNRTDQQLVDLLMSLRRLRFTAPELAELLEMPVSTISGILKRIGMGQLGRLGLEPAVRDQREHPLDGDAVALMERVRATKKRDGGAGLLIGQDLDVGGTAGLSAKTSDPL
jgi:hypothetical protein